MFSICYYHIQYLQRVNDVKFSEQSEGSGFEEVGLVKRSGRRTFKMSEKYDLFRKKFGRFEFIGRFGEIWFQFMDELALQA